MKPGDYCDYDKTEHRFSVYIDCKACGQERETEIILPCMTVEWSAQGFTKRIGCKNCHEKVIPWGDEDYFTVGMAMYCRPRREDNDYKLLSNGYMLNIITKNMD